MSPDLGILTRRCIRARNSSHRRSYGFKFVQDFLIYYFRATLYITDYVYWSTKRRLVQLN